MSCKRYSLKLAAIALLISIVSSMQCGGNEGIGKGGEEGENTPEKNSIELEDAIVNAIQDDFVKKHIKELTAGQKIDICAVQDPCGVKDWSLPTLAIVEPQNSLALLKYLRQHGVPLDTGNSYSWTAHSRSK